jgi:hypothetical protein
MLSYKIFREYKKNNDTFIALNNFYISKIIDNSYIQYDKYDIVNNVHKEIYEKIVPYCDSEKELYIIKSKEYFSIIDLILVEDISFSIDDLNITKSEIIKKLLDINLEKEEESEFLSDKLFKDLYYNENFSKKINIDYPGKEKNIKTVDKKYLFRIHFLENNMYFEKEKELF